MKYMAAFTVAALLAMLPTQSHAKNCKNSQPCGNSCISWSKTCRVGTPAYKPAPAYRPAQDYRYAPARSAPTCRNSQPCGNTCIPLSSTCRVGSSTP